MAIDTNTFFITAPFATDGLRAKVAKDRARLEALEAEYSQLKSDFVSLSGELTVMEEKSGFLERQIVRSMTIFEPPPEGDYAAEMAKKQVGYDVLFWTSTVAGGVGGVMMIVGQLGLSRTVKKSLAARKLRTVGKIKAGAKLGRAKVGAGRAVIAGARSARAVQATKAAKLGKFGKIAKIGRASGVLSVALVALDIGLKMATAAKMNAYFVEQADEIKKVIQQADEAVAALKAGVAEGSAMRKAMLADAGCATVVEYLEKLNRAIADVGRANARRSLVRRMLLDGMALDLVAQYSELAADEVAALSAKLTVELGLLRDEDVPALVAASGLGQLQVEILKRMFDARMALLAGADAEQVAQDYGLSDVTVSGVATSLARDIRQVWALFEKDTAPELIARKALFPVIVIEQFALEIATKRLLLIDSDDASVVAKSGATSEQVVMWRNGLDEDLSQALGIAAQSEAHVRRSDIAADFRLPIEAVA